MLKMSVLIEKLLTAVELYSLIDEKLVFELLKGQSDRNFQKFTAFESSI